MSYFVHHYLKWDITFLACEACRKRLFWPKNCTFCVWGLPQAHLFAEKLFFLTNHATLWHDWLFIKPLLHQSCHHATLVLSSTIEEKNFLQHLVTTFNHSNRIFHQRIPIILLRDPSYARNTICYYVSSNSLSNVALGLLSWCILRPSSSTVCNIYGNNHIEKPETHENNG